MQKENTLKKKRKGWQKYIRCICGRYSVHDGKIYFWFENCDLALRSLAPTLTKQKDESNNSH